MAYSHEKLGVLIFFYPTENILLIHSFESVESYGICMCTNLSLIH